MSSSPARVEANRMNALRSTGPKTPEGKQASRRNALKHAMTGGGIVVPDADLPTIAQIAQEIRDQYAPSDPIGLAMADHAATLIVRLDRCGRHESALIDDQIAAAKYDFDQARRDWADELFDGLMDNPASVVELYRFPEGIDRLIEGWSTLGCVDDWSDDDLTTISILSNSGFDDLSASTIRSSIPGLIDRLEAAQAAIDRRPINRARQHAADLALFGMTPEAILARRYEAATVRALEKARTYLENYEGIESLPEAPEQIDPAAPLGSFLPGQPPRPASDVTTRPDLPAIVPVSPEPPVERSKRPDPRKSRAMMDRKRD